MNSYKKMSQRKGECLECGTELDEYARSNKKFCCEECRYAYNNHKRRAAQQVRIKVDGILAKNYKVLERCLEQGRDCVSISDIVGMGFNPTFVTSQLHLGSYYEFTCYDIVYRLSDTKVFNIHRMFVNLRNGKF